MAGVIEEVCKALEPSASARGISIRTDVEPIRFVADMEQMTQLVRNLVDNSIQYGIDGGFVDIRLHSADGGFRLEVEDNGIGIPKGDQTRVFERFYRVDKARSKTTGGTGLGLSIVKHICLIHQATLRLESELGKGTVISIFFPQK
jgi:two-component system phosphate regulon sensor histidine kinase PhoR